MNIKWLHKVQAGVLQACPDPLTVSVLTCNIPLFQFLALPDNSPETKHRSDVHVGTYTVYNFAKVKGNIHIPYPIGCCLWCFRAMVLKLFAWQAGWAMPDSPRQSCFSSQGGHSRAPSCNMEGVRGSPAPSWPCRGKGAWYTPNPALQGAKEAWPSPNLALWGKEEWPSPMGSREGNLMQPQPSPVGETGMTYPNLAPWEGGRRKRRRKGRVARPQPRSEGGRLCGPAPRTPTLPCGGGGRGSDLAPICCRAWGLGIWQWGEGHHINATAVLLPNLQTRGEIYGPDAMAP